MVTSYFGKLSERSNNGMRTIIEMTIGLAVMAGAVQAQTLINTCPFVISSPGRYVLANDVVCFGGGTGITITSSHVTLALERHTIFAGVGNISAISNSSGGGTGTPVTDVHILGPGLIFSDPTSPFTLGVSLVGSVTDSEVSGITVQGQGRALTVGINADGQAIGTTGLTITKNTIVGGTVGISVINLTSSTISENVASGFTVAIGINNAGVTSGSPIKLSGNIVVGNPNTGIDINNGFVTAQNNIISGNGTVGISVSGPGATIALEIINNTALANGTLDLFDTVPNCAGTVWSGNTFFKANQSCIH
jgi:hypothetical protein